MTAVATTKIFSNGFSKGNIGANETELKLFNIEPGLLSSNGDHLEISATGEFAKNNNAKRVKLFFGSTLIMDSGPVTQNGGKWEITATVTRTGASAQSSSAAFSINGVQQSTSDTTPAHATASEIPVKISGQGTADRDVLGKTLDIKYFKVGN